MVFINCSIDECIERNRGRRIFVFGAGGNIRFYESSDMKVLKDNVVGVLDNGGIKSIKLFGRTIPAYHPDYIKGDQNCSVIITTSVYMVEMYEQLLEMNLTDDVEVYIYPLMTLEDDHELSETEKELLFSDSRSQKIPKIIHCFWFSESKKPKEYQTCVDSWKRYCPDYEIREYSTHNYDTTRHPFLKKAIEVEAWAYATDYARLDVLSREGGIYMDMDVEVLKPLDSLLGHEGVFSFFNDGGIDLAAFMVSSDNPLPEKVMKLYDDIPVPDTKKGFEQYYQPQFAMPSFEKYGVQMNGRFQIIEDNLFLPRYLMMPLDCAIYQRSDKEDTFMVHHANAGWKENSYGARKAERNRAFYEKTVGKGFL